MQATACSGHFGVLLWLAKAWLLHMTMLWLVGWWLVDLGCGERGPEVYFQSSGTVSKFCLPGYLTGSTFVPSTSSRVAG